MRPDQSSKPDGISKDHLVHYFAGECSEKESAAIEAWIGADPVRKRDAAQLRQIWDAGEQPPREDTDVDMMWERLTRRLPRSEFRHEESKGKPHEPDSMRSRVQLLSRPMKTHMESRKRSSVYEGNDVLFEKPPHALS